MSNKMQLTITPGYESVSSHEPGRLPVLLQVEAPTPSTNEYRPPVTLHLCIDNSSSMHGEPLDLVKQAARLVLKELRPDDKVGLVSFSDRVQSWSPPAKLDASHRRKLKQAIDTIQAEGSTAMYGGLHTALQELPRLAADEIGRVLLLTDGHPNEGPCSNQELCGLIKEWKRNCVVSTFGFGNQHNEDLLQQMAQAGGGRYTYIDNVQSVGTAFAMELGSMFSTVAKDARLYLQPSAHCSIEKVHGNNELKYTARGLELALSDWIAGQTMALLVELQITPDSKWGDSLDCGAFLLTYTTPEDKKAREYALSLQMPMCSRPSSQKHPLIIEQELLLQAAEAWLEARRYADQGRYIEAIQVLEPHLMQLKQHPAWHDEGSAIRDWYEQFVDEKDLYLQRPDRQWYQDFRKQAVAEMALPGAATGGASPAALVACAPRQTELAERFRTDDGKEGSIEVWEGNHFQGHLPIQREVTIGRVQSNDIVLPKGNISKRHARIILTQQGFILNDLRSSNGLFLNGAKVQEPRILREGDQIFMGDFRLIFHEPTS